MARKTECSDLCESGMETEIDLFESVMKRKWEDIIKECKKTPKKMEEIITRSEDTILHLAVLVGRAKVVSELVAMIKEEDPLPIVGKRNANGNTPLHLAAKLGNEEMCKCLANKRPDLIACQNKEKETPLFLSAVYGKKAAFLCLHKLYKQNRKNPLDDDAMCRKDNGDTILHCAILGEYFSLAFEILQLYPQVANFINEDGLSPLHILATKRNAFKSGSLISLFDKVVFQCITIDEDEDEGDSEKDETSRSKTELEYPDNYSTCMNFFRAIKKIVFLPAKMTVSSLKDAKQKNETGINDVENPQQKGKGRDDTEAPAPTVEGKQKTDKDQLAHNNGNATNQPKKKDKPATNIAENFPPNYRTFVQLLIFLCNALLVILGLGIGRIKKVREKKVRHTWAMKIMNKLVQLESNYKYDANGRNPETLRPTTDGHTDDFFLKPPLDHHETSDKHASQTLNTTDKNLTSQTSEKKESKKSQEKGTAILIAAKTGVIEIVEKILDSFPVAIQDLDDKKKNVVLLSVEHRQTYIFEILQKSDILKESAFSQLDCDGNGALHLAAKKGEHIPWLIAGDALQMQWEYKWYKFVKDSMPRHFVVRHNKAGKTPKAIFRESHKGLVKSGREWLTKTSESCSVVAALIATVSFATSATVPGGVKEDYGTPTLQNRPAFNVFAVSSLFALCFSVTSLVFFLAILTSRYQESDFKLNLPRKLLIGLTSLFASIAAILVSFCAGHFFILTTNLRYIAYPIYAATCLPITFFAFAHLPLYFDLTRAIFVKVPQPSHAL